IFSQTQLTGTFAFLEAERRYRALTFAQSLSKILQVPFLLVLSFAAMRGAAAVVFSQALAALSVIVIWWARSVPHTSEHSSERPSARMIADSAKKAFGWSLYLFSLFSWVLATSDRYILEHFRGAAEVGIYAVNYGLWSVPYI